MLDLPTPKLEAWKFTHFARAHSMLPEAAAPQITLQELEALLPVFSAPQVVFYNGKILEPLGTPLPQGVSLSDTGARLSGPTDAGLDGLDSLAVAQRWWLHISRTPPVPMVILHVAGSGCSALDITLDEGCDAQLIEVHCAPAHHAGWQHQACTIEIGAGAKLTHSVLNVLPDSAQLLHTRRQRQTLAAGAQYIGSVASFGGGLLRTEVHTTLDMDCTYHLTSLACPRADQHHDVTLQTRHEGTGNTVVIKQRNLQADSSHAVFQGKFYVAQAAQKTDAYMHCHTLLLNDGARTSTKPELEIYADDVKCSHGAACGGLNSAQLFYLQARGLPEAAARALLVQGFADEFVAAFPAVVKKILQARVAQWLAGGATAAPALTDFSGDWLANTKAAPEPREIVREFGDEQ